MRIAVKAPGGFLGHRITYHNLWSPVKNSRVVQTHDQAAVFKEAGGGGERQAPPISCVPLVERSAARLPLGPAEVDDGSPRNW
jgi:hypothetical protein